jgi:hypothetical protein
VKTKTEPTPRTWNHPDRGHEAPMRAKRRYRGLVTTCVWCHSLLLCEPYPYGAGGYFWEELPRG